MKALRGVWRRRLRPLWHDVRPAVIVTSVVLVLLLGTIGFLDYRSSYHWDDALYRAFQLFGFGGTIDDPTPPLRVARILGVLLVSYAAVRGFLALTREQAQLLSFRLLRRNHVVIAGLGSAGFELARRFYRSGYRVLVVERNPANPQIAGCRSEGVPVLVGDATLESVLARAGVSRAQRLVVVCGDDIANMDVSVAARAVTVHRRLRDLVVHVELDDFDLWREMKAHSLIGWEDAACRAEPFNVLVSGAQLLLRDHSPFPDDPRDSGRPDVLMVGLDGVGPNLLLDLLRRWQLRPRGPDDLLRIAVAGEAAGRQLSRLAEMHPEIETMPDVALAAIEHAADSAALRHSELLRSCGSVYVCLDSEEETLAVGLMLSSRSELGTAQVVLTLPSETGSVADVLERRPGPVRLYAFGVLTRTLTPEELVKGTNDLLARATHDIHLRGWLERQDTDARDPSLVPWDELPESLQQSNHRFADRIAEHLASRSCVAVPAPLVDPRHPPFAFSDEEVEEMAPREHEWWERDMRRDGWRPTRGEKDAERKVHPLLGVAFADLPSENQDKDREHVRAIPEILALAGFDVTRIGQDGAAATIVDWPASLTGTGSR